MKRFVLLCVIGMLQPVDLFAHGTAISPISRVRRIYESNPENPNFQLAANAVAMDGTNAYYTWNEVSRNIPDAVQAGLPAGFDYSPWVPDGAIASGGRTDPAMGNTYLGLDQVSPDWPTTTIQGGETLAVDFFATAPHNPSVWDVWMTTPSWEPTSPLTWSEMEFLERPEPIQIDNFYYFDVDIPADRSGHHVLWIAWQRDDPVGEVFFSTSDVFVNPATLIGDFDGNGAWDCADLDLLSEAIIDGNHDPSFDLNGDQLVTADDVLDPNDGWLTVAGASPASPTQGNPYQPGDANLDGNVDGQDFLAWNLHKFTAATGWCQGDFNLDGLVDGSDFLVWNDHKFTAATAVPEPRGAWLAMLVLVSLVGSLRTGTTRQQGSPA